MTHLVGQSDANFPIFCHFICLKSTIGEQSEAYQKNKNREMQENFDCLPSIHSVPTSKCIWNSDTYKGLHSPVHLAVKFGCVLSNEIEKVLL